MKKPIQVLLVSVTALLSGCAGSDSYMGDWKGTDINGEKYLLHFEPKSFFIKRSNGDSLNFQYVQQAVKIENGIRTYGIRLHDGRTYQMVFPVPNDADRCVMTMENGKPVYTLGRTSYVYQDEIYGSTESGAHPLSPQRPFR